jgi:23S rRNA (guanine2445-N2)-methyltransferase / 23S rRNA (guanine2069-N7)-methyltransferase
LRSPAAPGAYTRPFAERQQLFWPHPQPKSIGYRRPMSGQPAFIATCALGLEPVLEAELRALKLPRIRSIRAAVVFGATIEDGYRALLWSRVASRILVQVGRFPCADKNELYHGVRSIPWADHLSTRTTFAVDFVGVSATLRHSGYAARVVKDAIVDQFRDEQGDRPDVDPQAPDFRVHAHLAAGKATISIDLAGPPLHERGLNREAGEAPLKENVAAAILHIAGWSRAVADGQPLCDPMCGSGTILLEAGMMARDVAPGLHRRRWGHDRWLGHSADTWAQLIDEARQRQAAGRTIDIGVYGGDHDPDVLPLAVRNLARAGFGDLAGRLVCRDARSSTAPEPIPGLLVTNPPYGTRLQDQERADALLRDFGDTLRHNYLGWTAWVLVGRPRQARALGLRPKARHPVRNGRLDARLLEVPIADQPPQGGPRGRDDKPKKTRSSR